MIIMVIGINLVIVVSRSLVSIIRNINIIVIVINLVIVGSRSLVSISRNIIIMVIVIVSIKISSSTSISVGVEEGRWTYTVGPSATVAIGVECISIETSRIRKDDLKEQ